MHQVCTNWIISRQIRINTSLKLNKKRASHPLLVWLQACASLSVCSVAPPRPRLVGWSAFQQFFTVSLSLPLSSNTICQLLLSLLLTGGLFSNGRHTQLRRKDAKLQRKNSAFGASEIQRIRITKALDKSSNQPPLLAVARLTAGSSALLMWKPERHGRAVDLEAAGSS